MSNSIRIDKFLWSVRIFKTRTMASDACKNNRVKINEQSLKPSKEVHVGDVILINIQGFMKSIRVIQLLNNRVGAKLVPDYIEDLTSDQEYDKLKIKREINHEYRLRGMGRPTKKERRMIDHLKNNQSHQEDE